MLNIEIMYYLDQKLDSITFDPAGGTANIFDNNMPESPDNAVMIENTGGSSQHMRVSRLKQPAIRILTRGQGNPIPPKRQAKNIISLMGNYNDAFFAPAEATWDSVTTYPIKTVVEHDDILYLTKQENTNVEPGVDSKWSNYWIELEGHFVYRCQAIQDTPANVGRDEDNRIRYSINFELRTVICNIGVN